MELRWRELHGHVAPEVCAGAGARECRSQARGGRQLAGSTLDQRPAVSARMEAAKSNPPRMERGRELPSKGISSPGMMLPTAGVPIPGTPRSPRDMNQRITPLQGSWRGGGTAGAVRTSGFSNPNLSPLAPTFTGNLDSPIFTPHTGEIRLVPAHQRSL